MKADLRLPNALPVILFALTVTACVTPGTMTWPGVDVQKADAFREALYEECILYTNTHNMRPDETLADFTPKRFNPKKVIVMDMYGVGDGLTTVNFTYPGWNLSWLVDFARGRLRCGPEDEIHDSPALQKYLHSQTNAQVQ